MTPRDALAAQVEAWNRGDLEGFVASCADDVVMVGVAGETVGKAALAAGYRAAYPDRAAMGRLTLDVVREDVVADRAVLVVRWEVVAVTTRGGFALLVLDRREDGWALRYDATLRAP